MTSWFSGYHASRDLTLGSHNQNDKESNKGGEKVTHYYVWIVVYFSLPNQRKCNDFDFIKDTMWRNSDCPDWKKEKKLESERSNTL